MRSSGHELSYACAWMVPRAALLLLLAYMRDEHDGLLGHGGTPRDADGPSGGQRRTAA
jgi:hypothetical protein